MLFFSNFYFWYFAFVGVFFPYFSLYLNWLGFHKLELSILLSIGPLTRIVAPYFGGAWPIGWLFINEF